MNNFVRKFKKLIDSTKLCIRYIGEFDLEVATWTYLSVLHHNNDRLGRYLTDKKEMVIKNYIYNITVDIQKKYENIVLKSKNIKNNSNIWVCWLQGMDNASKMIKACVKSIQKNSGTHNVVIITVNNYEQYVSIPEYIKQKYKAGKMCPANFADILRVALLAEYGGIWIDATVFMVNAFDESIYNYKFCSHKRKNQPLIPMYPAKNRWGTYFLASGKGSILFNYVRDVFFEFWSKKNISIDYGMIDFIMALGYEKNAQIKQIIDDSPYYNETMNQLWQMLNEKYSEEVLNQLANDTNMFKLTRKKAYIETVSGEETFYGHICSLAGE